MTIMKKYVTIACSLMLVMNGCGGEPADDSAPVTDPAPITDSGPVADPAPVTDPGTVVDPARITDLGTVVDPGAVADPAPEVDLDQETDLSADELLGTWVIDVGALELFDSFQSLLDAEKVVLRAAGMDRAGLEVEFTADAMNFIMTDGEGSDRTYRVSARNGGSYTLETTDQLDHTSTVPAEVKGDHLLLEIAGQLLAFRRQA